MPIAIKKRSDKSLMFFLPSFHYAKISRSRSKEERNKEKLTAQEIHSSLTSDIAALKSLIAQVK